MASRQAGVGWLVVAIFAAGLVLEWLHPLPQPGAYHDFADARRWLGVPNAANVLSNVPISLAGIALLAQVFGPWQAGAKSPGLVVASFGLMLTGLGSAYYHYAPGDATLIWDRLPLAVVFAGALLTAWACSGIGAPSQGEAVLVVLASLGSVAFWVYLGSLWPYVILQFGSLLGLLYLAARNRLQPPRAWWTLIALYGLAKVFELLDKPIWDLTGQFVSGHTLKHLASAAAGACFLWIAARAPALALRTPRPCEA